MSIYSISRKPAIVFAKKIQKPTTEYLGKGLETLKLLKLCIFTLIFMYTSLMIKIWIWLCRKIWLYNNNSRKLMILIIKIIQKSYSTIFGTNDFQKLLYYFYYLFHILHHGSQAQTFTSRMILLNLFIIIIAMATVNKFWKIHHKLMQI